MDNYTGHREVFSCDFGPRNGAEHVSDIVQCFELFFDKYGGHLESKERFAIKKYLLTIGKKKNMQVLSHTFTYFST